MNVPIGAVAVNATCPLILTSYKVKRKNCGVNVHHEILPIRAYAIFRHQSTWW
jgi:hypothetical protein